MLQEKSLKEGVIDVIDAWIVEYAKLLVTKQVSYVTRHSSVARGWMLQFVHFWVGRPIGNSSVM